MTNFDLMLDGLIARKANVDAPGGLEQRLLARMAQEDERTRPALFTAAERMVPRRGAAGVWTAFGLHAAALMLIVFFVAHEVKVVVLKPKMVAQLNEPVPPPPPVAPKLETMGGGGGQHDAGPVTEGHLPKLAQQQIVPPKAPPMEQPKLVVEPTVVVQPDLKLAENHMPNIGAPNSTLKGFSMGNGSGTGIGSGDGAGIGPGSGGNVGGGVMHVGGSVLAPVLTHEVDPDFSEEARKAKFSGNVLVGLIIDEQGLPSRVHCVRDVGMGLCDKAVEAVRQYRFKPATQNGKPVKVSMNVDVQFEIF